MAQSFVRLHWAKIGAADIDVDDIADRLSRVTSYKSALETCSGIYKPACSDLLGSSDGKPQVHRLRVMVTSLFEGMHIRLRCPVPHHLACVEVSVPAHCLTCRIVVQKFNCRCCDRHRIHKGDQRSASIGQEFGRVSVRSRNDRLAGAQGIRQGLRLQQELGEPLRNRIERW